MKSKDKETLKNMGDAEMKAQAADLGKQLFQLKFKRTTSPIENPLALRTARRKIARINTYLRQRELAKSKAMPVPHKGYAHQAAKTAEVKK